MHVFGSTRYAFVQNVKKLNKMHVFGSTRYAFVHNVKKLDDRSRKGIFLGYDKERPTLVFYTEINKIEKVRYVTFTDNFRAEKGYQDKFISNEVRQIENPTILVLIMSHYPTLINFERYLQSCLLFI